MKKIKRDKPMQFFVHEDEKLKILQNMERNGMANLSEFLRILALSDVEITFGVKMPNVIRVSDAQLGSGEEVRTEKSALG